MVLTVASLCGVVGCSQPFAWNPISYDRDSGEQEVFATGDNRPPTAKTLFAMSRLLEGQGRSVEYEAVLIRIVREHPTFMPAYCALARHRVQQNRLEDATQTLRAGLRVSPHDPILLNNLGLCYLTRGAYDEARQAFAEAAGVDPQNPRYRANLAAALGMLGRESESLALFRQVVRHDDADYNVFTLRKARDALEDQTQPIAWPTRPSHSDEIDAEPPTPPGPVSMIGPRPGTRVERVLANRPMSLADTVPDAPQSTATTDPMPETLPGHTRRAVREQHREHAPSLSPWVDRLPARDETLGDATLALLQHDDWASIRLPRVVPWPD